MIRAGQLTHGDFVSSFDTWQPSCIVVNTLLITFLTTVLAYQATAIIFDLFLGFKPRGQATASNLHTLLLTDESSPLSLAAAVFRRDTLDHARFPGDIPPSTDIGRGTRAIRPTAVAKLLLLLLAAPLINLFAIILTLESTDTVSFARADFGGVALGVNPDLDSVRKLLISGQCGRLPVNVTVPGTEPRVEFIQCQIASLAFGSSDNPRVTVRTNTHGEVVAQMLVPNFGIAMRVFVDLMLGGEAYRIKQVVTADMARRLLVNAKESIEEACNATEIGQGGRQVISRQQEAEVMVNGSMLSGSISVNIRRDRQCMGASSGLMRDSITKVITLVETDVFEAVKVSALPSDKSVPPQFERQDDVTFLSRRRSNVSTAVLLIVVAVVVAARLVVKLVIRNDTHDVLFAVVKRQLAAYGEVRLFRRAGRDAARVRYNCKYQNRSVAHYGLQRFELPEVDVFQDATLGFLDDDCVEERFQEREHWS